MTEGANGPGVIVSLAVVASATRRVPTVQDVAGATVADALPEAVPLTPRRVVLVLPNWVGDVVMATPAITALRQHFPHAELVGVCRPYVAEVLGGAPWLNELVLWDKRGPRSQRTWAVARRLRRQPPDLAVLFPNSLRAAILARLAGCRHVIGYARYGRYLLLHQRLVAPRDDQGRWKPTPQIDLYNRLAEAAGTPPPGYRMRLFTTQQDEAQAQQVWQRLRLEQYARVVMFHPGAAFGAAKLWPVESFAQLARRCVQQLDSAVLVLSGPAEIELARRIVRAARSLHVYELGDVPRSIGLTKALVRRADLLVSTDSGPRHFAAAFDRPVVTLFGPTHIAWTETYYARGVHLQKSVPCGPCQRRVCPLRHHRCMRELTPEEVFAAVERLLDMAAQPQQGQTRASHSPDGRIGRAA